MIKYISTGKVEAKYVKAFWDGIRRESKFVYRIFKLMADLVMSKTILVSLVVSLMASLTFSPKVIVIAGGVFIGKSWAVRIGEGVYNVIEKYYEGTMLTKHLKRSPSGREQLLRTPTRLVSPASLSSTAKI